MLEIIPDVADVDEPARPLSQVQMEDYSYPNWEPERMTEVDAVGGKTLAGFDVALNSLSHFFVETTPTPRGNLSWNSKQL